MNDRNVDHVTDFGAVVAAIIGVVFVAIVLRVILMVWI